MSDVNFETCIKKYKKTANSLILIYFSIFTFVILPFIVSFIFALYSGEPYWERRFFYCGVMVGVGALLGEVIRERLKAKLNYFSGGKPQQIARQSYNWAFPTLRLLNLLLAILVLISTTLNQELIELGRQLSQSHIR